MANPELGLPRASSDFADSGNNPEIVDSEKYTRPAEDSEKSSLRAEPLGLEDAITYHYLTFDTEIPLPASTASIQNESIRPEPPDLREYTSPFEWSSSRKSFITWLSCAATIVTAFTAGSYSSGTTQMEADWHISRLAVTVGITTFTTGFAIAPMFLAPFSEINGRRPIFIITGLLFVVLQLCCAVTRSYPGMLVARFFTGCVSSTFSTMVGGVVSDIYHSEDRNTAMALFSGAALFGTGLGPLVCGFIAQYTTWRWIFYLQVITCGITMIFIVFFFKETRGSVLLSRKAKALNKYYEALEAAGYVGVNMPVSCSSGDSQEYSLQRIRWKVKSDEERGSLAQMVSISLYRPFHLLFTEPVVFFFSLWISFSWAVLYLTFGAIPLVFSTNHDFELHQSGAVFTAISVAAIISTILSVYQEKLAKLYFKKILTTPEGRLYFACIQSALLPIGLFWFGWTSFRGIPWIVPALAIGCATMGIFSIYLAVFNYLADVYHRYASSALAAQSFCRNMLGGVFPLITELMFRRMTFQGAGSFLGGIGALLTLVPWVLVFYGPRIRARSKFAREIMD
ncbi:hypothetical protein LTR66_001013 [Elasticomyces elasticus]|nr:hypothetical protein LTR66_001013 [Elasticomyces elasticus]